MKAARMATGERKKQALAAIKEFERKKQLWGSGELAAKLDCSQAQAWQLMQSLTFTGELVRGQSTVVIPDALITAA